MNRKLLLIIPLLAYILSSSVAIGQGHSLEALRTEYPLLMKRYGDRLESRSAHYIFAIDISSSMQEYEDVVRQSLATFVKAVPDGDQVTFIAMSDENSTNYFNSIKCITINPNVRQSIVSSITSPQFRFLRRGDANDGSDGFTMTRKVLEAMNVVNSSDLTFVYLLTDFEYWTHRNKFDKNAEDWNSLKSLLTEKHVGMMCKYGIELNSAKVSHPEAVFKTELDNIFGQLDYQQANSAEILAQWFGHIVNDIRAHKINAMLKVDWKEYMDSVRVSLRKEGCRMNAVIEAPQSDLVSGINAALANSTSNYLTLAGEVAATMDDDNLWTAAVGSFETKGTWYPSTLRMNSTDVALSLNFESPYAEEIHKLQGVCQGKAESSNSVNLNREFAVTVPSARLWNSIIPLWLWMLIIAVMLLVVVSVILKYMQNINGKTIYFEVKRKVAGKTTQSVGDTNSFPYSVGVGGNLAIQGATWLLNFTTRRYNPILNPFKKTGYYVTLEAGDYAGIVDQLSDEQVETLKTGDSAMLFRHNKTPMVRIEITEGSNTNIISIS